MGQVNALISGEPSNLYLISREFLIQFKCFGEKTTGFENLVQPSRSLDSFKLPAAHRIRSDQEAIQTAHQIAKELEAEASVRDRERHLPHDEIELLTRSGLWGITIPKAFGGPGVSHSTLVEVFAILAAADPSFGQIPHNHFCVIDAIRLEGTEE
jgi:alkylation response protein AidB-like acyl-CoA dehydrogenase